MLSKIDVFLDADTLEHKIELVFQLPIVGEEYTKDEAIGSKLKVVKGVTKQVIQGSYGAKVGRKNSKKKH